MNPSSQFVDCFGNVDSLPVGSTSVRTSGTKFLNSVPFLNLLKLIYITALVRLSANIAEDAQKSLNWCIKATAVWRTKRNLTTIIKPIIKIKMRLKILVVQFLCQICTLVVDPVFKMIVKECWHYNDKRECQKKVTQRHHEAGFRRVTFMTAIFNQGLYNLI